MSRIDEYPLALDDHQPFHELFHADVIEGLSRPHKRLPCKYFYDEAGSALFDQICCLNEYYPTRTELAITRSHAAQIARLMGPAARLVEFGSGSSLKTRVLLDVLIKPAGYVPIDISREHLLRSAASIAEAYPSLCVTPVTGDYTSDLELPDAEAEVRKTVAYFPGSTIGNFEPREALSFLRRVRALSGDDSALLIGVDVKKDPRQLHAAYNDSAGVTADFNLNLLARINRELDGNFSLDTFSHYACFNPGAGRVEMHLVSLEHQSVRVGDQSFEFECGEGIHTENCYKYTPREFAALAARAGWRIVEVWTDEMRLFSLQYLISS